MSERLERLWATWRADYIRDAVGESPAAAPTACVFCEILAMGDEYPHLVHRGDRASVILNAHPYNSGHVLVLPDAHEEQLDALEQAVIDEIFHLVQRSVRAISAEYNTDGVNFGANLGRAAGAGIPDHLHVHVVPRWTGDTNFMTTTASARVLPESLDATAARLRDAFSH